MKNIIVPKGKRSKIFIDIVIIFILFVSIMFRSIVPLLNNPAKLFNTNIYLLLYAILDFITLMNFSILYICSNKSTLTDNFLLINFLGMLLYTLSDLLSIYAILFDTYFSSTILDSLWIISLLLIGLSGIHYLYIEENKNKLKNIAVYENQVFISYLAIIPIILLLNIDMQNNYQAIVGVFVSIIVIRQMKVLNQNTALVEEYRLINARLESDVFERTKELLKRNKELNYLSNIDTLTNLYNRRYLLNKLDEIIENSSKDNSKFGILFLDLNRFKNINDLYGHEVGDLLLKEISKKLKKYSIENSVVARHGGDEFIIISTNINNEEDLKSLAIKIISEFDKKICIKKINLEVKFSIGAAIYPTDGEDKLTIMKKADMAMYVSKKSTSSKFNLYKEEYNISNKFKMEELMKNAISNKEFVLYYQPQFNIENNKIIGVEALIRWINDELGFVSPSEFIPLAEETGLIIDIGNWVIESTFLQIKKWHELYNADIEVGINISPIQLSDEMFLDTIISNLKNTNINSSLINLEITEESAISDSKEIVKKLKKIRQLGIKVSIDDFGSGYSSFNYLKRFIVDTLKIDISLIRGIDKTQEDYAIAKAIINMSNDLGLSVVAEGVESESQLSVLRNLKCDVVQGYYYEKPMKVDELEKKYFIHQALLNSPN